MLSSVLFKKSPIRLVRLGFAIAFSLLVAACQENVLTALDQRDARDAQLILEQAGISASVATDENGTYSISVDSSEHKRALELVANAGLPRTPHRAVPDIFPANGFLVTPYEQKARMAYAVEQELAKTLSALENIADARVHVVLAEENGRGLIKEKARTSALLQYRQGAVVGDLEMKARALLLNSVRGLDYEDVSVILSPWREIGAAQPVMESSGVSAPSKSNRNSGFLEALTPRNLLIAGALVLAVVAGVLLVAPRRRQG